MIKTKEIFKLGRCPLGIGLYCKMILIFDFVRNILTFVKDK